MMITFLYPIYLYFLPIIGIPALIHLWNKRKRIAVEFSSLQFLEKIEKKVVRRLKIRELLLLLIRILVLLFIILAMSQPIFQSTHSKLQANGDNIFIIALDPSLSMKKYTSSGVTCYHQGVEIVQSLVRHLDSYGKIIVVNENRRDLGFGRYIDTRQLDESIPVVTNYPWNTNKLKKQLEQFTAQEKHDNVFLFIISDFQKSHDYHLASEGLFTYVIPIPPQLNMNWGIEDLKFLNYPLTLRKPIQVRINFSGLNLIDSKEVEVFLRINKKVVLRKFIDTPQKSNYELNLEFLPVQQGWNRAELYLTPDQFNEDNHFYFPFYVEKKKQLLYIQGSNDEFWDTILGPGERIGYYNLKSVSEDNLPKNLDSIQTVFLETNFSNAQNILNILNNSQFNGTILAFPRIDIDSTGLDWLLKQTNAGKIVKIVQARDSSEYLLYGNHHSELFDNQTKLSWYFKNYIMLNPANTKVLTRAQNRLPLWLEIESLVNHNKLLLFMSFPGPGNSNYFIHPQFLENLYLHILESGRKWQVSDLMLKMQSPSKVLSELSKFQFSSLLTPDGIRTKIQNGEISETLIRNPGIYLSHSEEYPFMFALNIDRSESGEDYYSVDELKQIDHFSVLSREDLDNPAAVLSSIKNLGVYFWWFVLAGIFMEMLIVKWDKIKGVIKFDRNIQAD